MLAPSNSGKTVTYVNLLSRDPSKSVFGRNIFLFSETAHYGDPSLHELHLREANLITTGYDESVIVAIMNEQSNIIKEYGQKRAPPLCLIFDDTAASFSNSNSMLRRLFFNGRHLSISVIVISQSVRTVPRAVRGNADWILAWELNQKESLSLAEEQPVNTHSFLQILDKATQDEPYSFLSIQLKNPIARRYQLRFSNSYFAAGRGVHVSEAPLRPSSLDQADER